MKYLNRDADLPAHIGVGDDAAPLVLPYQAPPAEPGSISTSRVVREVVAVILTVVGAVAMGTGAFMASTIAGLIASGALLLGLGILLGFG